MLKKWWFWIILFLGVLVIYGAITGTNNAKEEIKSKVDPVEVEEPVQETMAEEKAATPEEQAEEALKGNKNGEFIKMSGQFFQEPYSLQVEYLGKENLTNKMAVESMKLTVRNALYEIKELGLNIDNVGVSIKYPLKDQHGNTTEEYVIKSEFSGDTISNLNKDMMEFDTANLPDVADNWWEHDAIK